MSELAIPESADAMWRKWLRVACRLLLDPSARLDATEQGRAQLLASLLLSLAVLGLGVGFAQLATVPNFRATFIAIVAAVAVLGFGYAASRTRLYRLGAGVACAVPTIACAIIATHNPQDHVWYAFMLLGVVFATLFFSVKIAAAVAGGILAIVGAVVAWVPELRNPANFVPILAVHVVLSPLLVVGAYHQRRLERWRIEELRRKDARLAGMDRLEVLSCVVGSVVHDFNNLLVVVMANARELEREGSEKARERAREIRIASDTAVGLGRHLLAFASRQPAAPTTLCIDDVVRRVQPLLERMADRVTLIVRGAPNLPSVKGDPLQLEQVLLNLVINARDAMPNGGAMTIETQYVELDAAYVRLNPDAQAGPHVMTAVSDTGIGMDAATSARAFEPFFSTKGDGGSGVGLATVRGVITQAGGHVTVASQLGIGTTFRIYLPCEDKHSEAPSE